MSAITAPSASSKARTTCPISFAAAVLIGDGDQLRRGFREIDTLGGDDLAHRLGIDHVGQAVGTQYIDVFRFDAVFGNVGRNDCLDAKRARDQVLVERIFGLLLCQHTAVDLLL